MVAAIQTVSPRHIVQRKALKDVARATALADNASAADPPLPNPGDMQLYSFYTPSLEAGTYTISTKQNVYVKDPRSTIATAPATTTTKTPTPTTPTTPPTPPPPDAELVSSRDQKFEVVAPQFSIDPKDIHSCYPPQGHADQAYVVPHIVFNDPHLPWERRAVSETIAESLPDFKQNRIPWMALLNFDPNGTEQELRMSGDFLKKVLPADLIANLPPGAQLQKANSLAVTMTVEKYLKLGTSNQILLPKYVNVHDRDMQKLVDVVFLTSKQFKAFFTDPSNPSKVNLARYRLLSHVRNINTIGMPQSGVEDQGLFSIVLSHRSGPTDIKPGSPPRTQIVHLFSIEFINDMDVIPGTNMFVPLISLASWSYQCQPPLGVNFIDTMYDIGMQLKNNDSCLLRPPDKVLASMIKDLKLESENLTGDDLKAAQRRNMRRKMASTVYQRMSNGYTMLRQRLANGEETVAFTRGPLLPVQVARPTDAYSQHPMGANWPASSNFGQDFQLLDADLGIMDISYSTAWQLGKTLAIADSSFASALARVRGQAHTQAVQAVKSSEPVNKAVKSQIKILADLPDTINNLAELATNGHTSADLDPKKRWQLPSLNAGDGQFVLNSIPTTAPQKIVFQNSVKSTLSTQGSALGDTTKPFNEIFPPTSTDWALVHKWVMDKLYLSGIPHHYFITDSSHLPPETIRFFHIDQTWFDCFLDGALSIANHLSRADDVVRRNIKEQLNDFFKTEVMEDSLDHYPQVPTYGFLLRSKVVECFPDLRIEAPFQDPTTAKMRAPILSLRLIGKDILLCLLDRLPDAGELKWIKLSQPEHQQCFSIGDYLNDKYVQFKFSQIPPAPQGGNMPTPVDPKQPKSPQGQPTFGGATGTTNTPQANVRAKFEDIPELGFPHFDALYYPTDKVSKPDPATGTYSWETRCLNLEFGNNSFSARLMQQLRADPNWKDGLTTSALVGLEMNLPVYYLLLKPPTSTNPNPNPKPDPKGYQRSIWIGPSSSAPSAATAASSTPNTPKTAVSNKVQSTSSNKLVSQHKSLMQQFAAERATTNLNVAPGSGGTPTYSTSLVDPSSPISARDPVQFKIDRSWFDTSPWQNLKPRFQPPPPPNNRAIDSLQYTYRIYPSQFHPDKAFLQSAGLIIGFVPLVTPYDYDLVISVQRTIVDPKKLVNEKANAALFELSVRLPLPDAKTMPGGSDSTEPLLAITGLRNARLLSNQRWVVRVDLEPGWVVCRLIPRSSQWSSLLAVNKETSFRLNGVGSLLGGKAGFSAIMISETYRKVIRKDDTQILWEDQGQVNFGRFRVERKAWAPPDGW